MKGTTLVHLSEVVGLKLSLLLWLLNIVSDLFTDKVLPYSGHLEELLAFQFSCLTPSLKFVTAKCVSTLSCHVDIDHLDCSWTFMIFHSKFNEVLQ